MIGGREIRKCGHGMDVGLFCPDCFNLSLLVSRLRPGRNELDLSTAGPDDPQHVREAASSPQDEAGREPVLRAGVSTGAAPARHETPCPPSTEHAGPQQPAVVQSVPDVITDWDMQAIEAGLGHAIGGVKAREIMRKLRLQVTVFDNSYSSELQAHMGPDCLVCAAQASGGKPSSTAMFERIAQRLRLLQAEAHKPNEMLLLGVVADAIDQALQGVSDADKPAIHNLDHAFKECWHGSQCATCHYRYPGGAQCSKSREYHGP